MAPGAYILHTLKNSSDGVKKFHVNPVEYFCKIDEKLNFDLFWPYEESKRD